MPNPLSLVFPLAPAGRCIDSASSFNHFTELVVPFGYFAPQPVAAIAGSVTIFFQLWLMASGNFSFLGLLTIVLATSLPGRSGSGAAPAGRRSAGASARGDSIDTRSPCLAVAVAILSLARS